MTRKLLNRFRFWALFVRARPITMAYSRDWAVLVKKIGETREVAAMPRRQMEDIIKGQQEKRAAGEHGIGIPPLDISWYPVKSWDEAKAFFDKEFTEDREV